MNKWILSKKRSLNLRTTLPECFIFIDISGVLPKMVSVPVK